MKYIYLIISMLIISGCSNEQPKITKNNTTDKRNYYMKAYSHGCSTKKGTYKKNQKRYRENQTYLEGWNEGYNNCGRVSNRSYSSQGFQDGYHTAKTGKVTIRRRDSDYKKEFKKGYYYYIQSHK